jgi:tetratricopeptide (TPR) repeat protein
MAFHKAKALQEAEKSVAQGKIAQAIKQYQEILVNDPSDVSLLNTLGDLYIRDRNITEGLRQFQRLAEAYVREGFNVKAIAIYRKISKVDTNLVDALLKLAELYQLQGLGREAKEQYLQAAEFFRKRNQPERVLEVLRKLTQLDPENLNLRNRLAAECEQAGKRLDAANIYLESAEILLRRSDRAGAETALKKAAELDPKSAKVQLLRARVAMGLHQPAEAEQIINAFPALRADPAGKRVLLDAYLATRKLPEAETLAVEIYQADGADFTPLRGVSALLVERDEIDAAYQLLAGFAEPLIVQKTCGPLLEALRQIWGKAPRHLPTLELIHRICEHIADEATLPEVLEAMGHAYEEAGNLEKTEEAYLALAEREPENENYHALLNAVQRKLGRKFKPPEFSLREPVLMAAEDEPPAQPAAADVQRDAMVKEALENSDLFARYNLAEKAIGELEKVLQVYPDQVDVLQRIVEISRKGLPERGAAAAAQLARIFTSRGELEPAARYQAMAATEAPLEMPLPEPVSREPVPPPPPPPPPPETPAPGSTGEFPLPAIVAEEPAALPPPVPLAGVTFVPGVPGEPPVEPSTPAPLPEPVLELDLSGDLDALTVSGLRSPEPAAAEPVAPPVVPPALETPPVVAEAAVPPAIPEPVPLVVAEPPAPLVVPAPLPPEPVKEVAPPPVVPTEALEALAAAPEHAGASALEDSQKEIEFYLENGLLAEARLAVALLEDSQQGNQVVTELRRRLNEQDVEAAAAEEPEPLAPPAEVAAEPVAPAEPVSEEVAKEAPAPMAPAEVVAPAEPPVTAELAAPAAAEPLAPARAEAAPEPEPEPVAAAAAATVPVAPAEIAPAEIAPATVPLAPVEFAPKEPVPESPVLVDLGENPPVVEPPAPAAPVETAVAAEPPAPALPAPEPVPPPVEPLDAALPAPPEWIEVDLGELVAESPAPSVAEEKPVVPPPVAVPEEPQDEWALPTCYATPPPPAAASGPAISPPEPAGPVVPPAPPAVVPAPEPTPALDSAAMLGDLTRALTSSMRTVSTSPPLASAVAASYAPEAPPPGPSAQGAAQLSGLLEEMEESGMAAAAPDDPETHYNLGVAFREMGLLDEAIGEFQKVVKGSGKGNYPLNFLQVCSLLAICFMEKKMPAIAVRWYVRALETPGLDEEAVMALQYDLGVAYEQAGDARHALERFTEVYSQNIDFRDVAEKIRELQPKA